MIGQAKSRAHQSSLGLLQASDICQGYVNVVGVDCVGGNHVLMLVCVDGPPQASAQHCLLYLGLQNTAALLFPEPNSAIQLNSSLN